MFTTIIVVIAAADAVAATVIAYFIIKGEFIVIYCLAMVLRVAYFERESQFNFVTVAFI